MARRWEDLQSPQLALASEAGLLVEDAWNPDESDPFSLTWTEVAATYWAEAVDQMATRLGSRTHGLMMETFAERRFVESGEGSNDGEDLRIRVATMLAGVAPVLQSMEVPEILELRRAASAYLGPFRSEMLSIADGIVADTSVTTKDIAAEVEWRWARDVQPVLDELEHDIAQGSYGKSLMNALVADKGTAIAGAVTLAAGVGTVFAGLASLVPAGISAAYPFVRALNETRKSNADAQKHRLYFLHAASELAL